MTKPHRTHLWLLVFCDCGSPVLRTNLHTRRVKGRDELNKNTLHVEELVSALALSSLFRRPIRHSVHGSWDSPKLNLQPVLIPAFDLSEKELPEVLVLHSG